MSQEQKHKSTPEKQAPVCPKQAAAAKNEKLDADTKDMIDLIDDVLEEDCETFVKNYIQRGGE